MDSDDTQQPVVNEPAGQQLRRAREQKGLSVSAVADAQHLRPAVIHAIEDGAYEQIDSELFLKGYVRIYARQVGLDPDSLIATLDKELEPLRERKAQAEELNPLVDIERRRRQKRHIAKLLFFVLVIAIAVFVGLRFLDNSGMTVAPEEPGTSDMPSESVEESVEPAQSETDVSDASGAVGGSSGENGDVAKPLRTEVEPGSDELAVEDGGIPAPMNGQSEIPLVADSDSGEAARPVGEQASEPTGDIDESRVPVVTITQEPAFEESARPDAAVGNARLEMTFSGECWVQVTDSAGNRLLGSLQRDGDRVEVSGRVPIEVIVGAVDAVESIRFDGEAVDISEFRAFNNRAEFSLDI
ncbi:RodZ domain-containing protein [Marinobacter orientalis]|uniref:Helix-turn-helix domain-containing protein n=1 Tax=Marinobacter orientalis TaxID=1928859 RepID=A0A7Y0RES1_9GAMM|nr:RodZ domain-containing protein [Marinobacter orientalis]NMT64878.1 helix-turn-helix domain-containing protein [Marinobacter orientalis]TGX48866.1 helix-turn-helix domain-containing protein [Marinobacter orientalis]